MITNVLALSIAAAAAIAGLVTGTNGAAATADSLIKGNTDAVYYLGTDNKRYVFPNEKIFKSWYKDFSGVITVSSQELASYAIGGNIRYRPGTRLVKITTDPKVYAVGSGGGLYPVASEQAASSLFGPSWSQKIDDLPDAYFADYSTKPELDGSTHPEGTFFRYSDNTTTYFVLQNVDGTLRSRAVGSTGLNQFGLDADFAHILERSRFPYPAGESLTSDDAGLRYPNQRSGTDSTPNAPEEPQEPAGPAAISVASLPGLTSKMIVVRDDEQALLYGFALTGDKTRDVTMTGLKLHFYIDAGGDDADFVEGTDIDTNVSWPANLIVRDIALRDKATGAILDRVSSIAGDGTVYLRPSFTVKAGTTANVEIIGNVSTTPAKVRLSVSFTPSTELEAIAGSASSLTITPATALNGTTSPGIIIEPREYGTLKISTTSKGGDTFQHLGTSYSTYSLVFTSTGEPFTVRTLMLETTNEGPNTLVATQVSLTYKTAEGKTETDVHNEIVDNRRFSFINLDLYVPKNGTVEVPVTITTSTQKDVYSNSRLQLKYIPDNFSANSGYSGLQFTENNFPDSTKLVSTAGIGPLTIFREASMVFSSDLSTPTGGVQRQTNGPVMTFRVTAKEGPVKIYKMVFRIDTSDINVEGDDNDFLERFADVFVSERSGLYGHDTELLDRVRYPAQNITFSIYDASAGLFDDTPQGITTANGDYGVITYTFGGNAISLAKDETLVLDFDLDTTLFSTDKSNTFRVRLLGDLRQTAVSQANFLWDDGTRINASGYLLQGLDLSSATLGVDKL